MKQILTMVFAAVLLLSGFSADAQNKARRKSFSSWENYEIAIEKVGTPGTKFVKVWGFGKNVDAAVMAAKMNAVHACIFRGIPASTTAMATPPICSHPDALTSNQDYFEDFFSEGGPYLAYINMTTDGVPSGTDNRKVKGGYKVAIYVQVLYDNLKKKLENDGIVRGLSDGF